jgi:hypothetical protein
MLLIYYSVATSETVKAETTAEDTSVKFEEEDTVICDSGDVKIELDGIRCVAYMHYIHLLIASISVCVSTTSRNALRCHAFIFLKSLTTQIRLPKQPCSQK